MKKMEHPNANGSNPQNRGNVIRTKKIKDTWYFIAIIAILLVAGGAGYFLLHRKHYDEYSSLEQINRNLEYNLEERDSLVNEFVFSLSKIEDDLLEMQDKERDLMQSSTDPEITGDIRENIYNEIQNLNVLLKQNREQIQSLSKKLKSSGIQIAALEKKIGQLEQSIAQRDSSIHDLKLQLVDKDFMLTKLNTRVEELNTTILTANEKIMEAEETIKLQNEVLKQGHIAMGTYEELESEEVLTREGGFLGIGGDKVLKDNFSEEPFKTVDIIATRQIPVNARKANLITEHPEGSYELVSNDTMVSYLKITQPERFWKLTRYAVLETK